MLVLSRKRNESIVIGDNIVVTIVSLHRNKVGLGINAPPDIRIHRQEILDTRDERSHASARHGEVPEPAGVGG